jgi:hypothetical protein
MSFTDQLKEMWSNKAMRYGLIGAAVLGGYVLIKSKGKGSASGNSAQDANASYPGSYGSTFDSTGTDIASYLGNFQASNQALLDQYQSALKQTIATIPTSKASTPSTTTTVYHTKVWDTWNLDSILNYYSRVYHTTPAKIKAENTYLYNVTGKYPGSRLQSLRIPKG